MLRKFLTVILPFLLPFLIYGFYLLLRRYQAARKGQPPPPGWAGAPWGTIFAAAVFLTAATLVTYRFTIETQVQERQPPNIIGEPGTPPGGGD